MIFRLGELDNSFESKIVFLILGLCCYISFRYRYNIDTIDFQILIFPTENVFSQTALKSAAPYLKCSRSKRHCFPRNRFSCQNFSCTNQSKKVHWRMPNDISGGNNSKDTIMSAALDFLPPLFSHNKQFDPNNRSRVLLR